MTKGTVFDCRKKKVGAPITARSFTNVVSPCFCTAEFKKKPRAWDISNKSTINAKEASDSVSVQNIHMLQAH